MNIFLQTQCVLELARKAIIIGGHTSPSNVESILRSFTECLQRDSINKEEFNYFCEEAPHLVSVIADARRVTLPELRDMAIKGTLTTAVVETALVSQAYALGKKFLSLPSSYADRFLPRKEA